jgi:hypothetical protein
VTATHFDSLGRNFEPVKPEVKKSEDVVVPLVGRVPDQRVFMSKPVKTPSRAVPCLRARVETTGAEMNEARLGPWNALLGHSVVDMPVLFPTADPAIAAAEIPFRLHRASLDISLDCGLDADRASMVRAGLRLGMQNSSQERRRNSAPPPPKPAEAQRRWGGVRGASRGSVSVITTHALFALKVQRKLSNGVAGFAAGR